MRQSGSTALLTGTTPLAQFYTETPSYLRVKPAVAPPTGTPDPRAYVDFAFNGSACATSGNLVLVTGSSSNKCAQSAGFDLAGAGGSLRFGAQGAFYVCGTDQHVSARFAESPGMADADGCVGCAGHVSAEHGDDAGGVHAGFLVSALSLKRACREIDYEHGYLANKKGDPSQVITNVAVSEK